MTNSPPLPALLAEISSLPQDMICEVLSHLSPEFDYRHIRGLRIGCPPIYDAWINLKMQTSTPTLMKVFRPLGNMAAQENFVRRMSSIQAGQVLDLSPSFQGLCCHTGDFFCWVDRARDNNNQPGPRNYVLHWRKWARSQRTTPPSQTRSAADLWGMEVTGLSITSLVPDDYGWLLIAVQQIEGSSKTTRYIIQRLSSPFHRDHVLEPELQDKASPKLTPLLLGEDRVYAAARMGPNISHGWNLVALSIDSGHQIYASGARCDEWMSDRRVGMKYDQRLEMIDPKVVRLGGPCEELVIGPSHVRSAATGARPILIIKGFTGTTIQSIDYSGPGLRYVLKYPVSDQFAIVKEVRHDPSHSTALDILEKYRVFLIQWLSEHPHANEISLRTDAVMIRYNGQAAEARTQAYRLPVLINPFLMAAVLPHPLTNLVPFTAEYRMDSFSINRTNDQAIRRDAEMVMKAGLAQPAGVDNRTLHECFVLEGRSILSARLESCRTNNGTEPVLLPWSSNGWTTTVFANGDYCFEGLGRGRVLRSVFGLY
ncbi:hypothetical protein BDV19DRAFT_387659 [Aspergillus venezuelensis]